MRRQLFLIFFLMALDACAFVATPTPQATATRTLAPMATPTLIGTPTATPTRDLRLVAQMTALPTLLAQTLATPSRPITWTVQLKEIDGAASVKIYDAAAEIKEWIIRDYLAIQKFEIETQFKRVSPTLLATYYYRAGEQPMATRTRTPTATATFRPGEYHVAAIPAEQPRLPAPFDQPTVEGFDASGTMAVIFDYTAGGQWKMYDVLTHKPMLYPPDGAPFPPYLWIYRMQYDSIDGRWKKADSLFADELYTQHRSPNDLSEFFPSATPAAKTVTATVTPAKTAAPAAKKAATPTPRR